MKKVLMSVMAVAAMALTMTSCNKEEAANMDPITVNMEDNEILNCPKTHLAEDGYDVYWDNYDKVRLVDANNNSAIFYVTVDDNGHATFTYYSGDFAHFDRHSGSVVAYYPSTIGVNRTGTVTLPTIQTTVDGEPHSLPMYGEGNLATNFVWRNVCGIIDVNFSAPVTVDKITVTTDKYINGKFNVDITNLEAPLTYKGATTGHGSKTNTLEFTNGKDATNGITASIYLPAGTYKSINFTIYTTDGKQYTKRYNLTQNGGQFNIVRTSHNTLEMGAIAAEDFVTLNMGASCGRFAISENNYVHLANGNLMFVNFTGKPRWHFADNQWDCLQGSQNTGDNSFDRDLISWGANRYLGDQNIATGNSYAIWTKRFSTENVLAGLDEWGNNTNHNNRNYINNAEGTWRTLTETEWSYLLTNANPTLATLTFADVTGWVLTPADGTLTVGANLNKAEWNALENQGYIFLPVYKSRRPNGTTVTTTYGSYYWTANGRTEDNTLAYAVNFTRTAVMMVTIDKAMGAYIRLAQDIQ